MRRRLTLAAIFVVCQLAAAIASLWMFAAIAVQSDRAWRLAIAYDQLANAALGGSEDETISSRAHRARQEGKRWGCWLCGLLDRIEKDHCESSAGT